MGYQKLSKERQDKKRKAVDREEKRWARKSGTVQTRFVCPECGGPHSKKDHGVRDETPVPAKPEPRKRNRRARKPRGVPQEWTAAERAIIDDAMSREVRYKRKRAA